MPEEMTAVAEPAAAAMPPSAPETDAGATGEPPGAGAPGTEQPAASQQQDGRDAAADAERGIPKKYRDLFKTDKDLRRAYFESRDFAKHFPGGVKEAQEAAETLAEIGGPAGIAEIRGELDGFRDLDESFTTGSPEFIDRLATEAPQELARHLPRALEAWPRIDRDGYNRAMAGVLFSTITGAGIDRAAERLAQSSDAQAKQFGEELLGWLNEVRQIADSRGQERREDPRAAEIAKAQERLDAEKAEMFRSGVLEESMRTLNAAARPILEQALSRQKVNLGALEREDPDAAKLLRRNIGDALNDALTGDRAFLSNRDALMRTGDRERLMRMYRAAFDRHLPGVVQRVVRAFYRLGGAQAATATRQAAAAARPDAGAAGAPTASGKKPPREQIDYGRTTFDMLTRNEAFLKGQREKVSW